MNLNSFADFLDRIKIKARRVQRKYSKKKIVNYFLPDPFLGIDGDMINGTHNWLSHQRKAIIRLFEEHVYGACPQKIPELRFGQIRCETDALQGRAMIKEVDIYFPDMHPGFAIRVLLFIPKCVPKPVPVFFGLNFSGNHTVHPDPHISVFEPWYLASQSTAQKVNFPPFQSRGSDHRRWPIEWLLEKGYAVATACYGDIEPDFPGGWRYGLRSALPSDLPGRPGSKQNSWGAIAVWAWGSSRVMDYLVSDPDVNSSQVALIGHSRLGKAALWTGAKDERFALVVANNSGCGGAALFRRRYGETIKLLNRVRPHWFCQTFKDYNDREDELPVDQHMLIGLMAPRPVYIASASEDLAADPRGEFLSAREAGRIYELFGLSGLGVEDMPGLNESVGSTLGYHIRSGPHDLTDYDWQQFIRFAARHFGRNAVQ